METEEEELMTTGAVARELRISEQWVRNLASQGKIPVFCKLNGERVFRRSDVERVAAERKAGQEQAT